MLRLALLTGQRFGYILLLKQGYYTRRSIYRADHAKSDWMKTRLTLKPGQKGTKKLIAEYGDTLVCIRYRYDPQKKKR